ncbi:hypothetical protein ACP70R_039425 [Stipagrostis hirtigluma subsp. patula]
MASSMLVRAARGALAAGGGRGSCPLAARSCLLHGEARSKPPSAGCLEAPPMTSPLAASEPIPAYPIPTQVIYRDWPRLEVEEKDVESDESLWALYERWCEHFNVEHDPHVMARRFKYFKISALAVHRANTSNVSCRLALNELSDGVLSETILPAQNAAMQKAIAEMRGLPENTVIGWRNGAYYIVHELP